ncbi:substrate-binding domain-containing protein, partial [Salmonella enterica]|uniref:substrate-binding domain-containing protein n=1 Tax=Salmonella enterica TaxID=28901 RepID=UPI00398C4705
FSVGLWCGGVYGGPRLRREVPEDVAVVWFGVSCVSRVCQPPLPTMSVPHSKIGSEAGRALLERFNQGNWSDRKSIASSLCMLESC